LSQSLSVILPVCNVEMKLAQKVNELLEVATDLTSELELLIVDDGSTDNTEEVAMELCRQYPQVSILRHSHQNGEIGAARAGIAKTNGEVVLIHDIESPLSGDTIRQFWEMRNDKELVFARSESAHTERIPAMNRKAEPAWSGTQMLRREAVNELQDMCPTATIDRVTRTDLGDDANIPNSALRQLTASNADQLD
jgi:glycosyltransferase involved in cell wall biosynthesis